MYKIEQRYSREQGQLYKIEQQQHSKEQDKDELLLAASQLYEREQELDKEQCLREQYITMQEDKFSLDSLLQGVPFIAQCHATKQHDIVDENKRFAAPVTESDLLEKIKGAIPKATH